MDVDAEKISTGSTAPPDVSRGATGPSSDDSKLQRWAYKLEALTGLEARGIEPVPENERLEESRSGYWQIFTLWFSADLAAGNMALGLIGPLVFRLSFVDSALCCVFGLLLGGVGTAYISTFGPLSGNRTLVFSRYVMGYWPSYVLYTLQLVNVYGYGILNLIVTGQMLSALSPGGKLSIVVGIIIGAVITWAVSTFGMRIFHSFEKYAHWPQLVVLFVLVGVAGPNFDTTYASEGTGREITGARISYFLLNFSSLIGWSTCAADWFVYYPAHSSRWKVAAMTHTGMCVSCIFVSLLGIGLGTGARSNQDWKAASELSSGALMVEPYSSLGAFGKVLAVIWSLSPITNNIPGMYSAGLAFHFFGSWPAGIPRFVWNTVGIIACTLAAVAGQNHLFEVFQNLVSIMAYWISIWCVLIFEDEILFRRKLRPSKYDWTAWNDPKRLPLGLAASIAFCVGWAGALLGMNQKWFVGPIGREVKGDIGSMLAIAWAGIVYPPLRVLEQRWTGR